MKAIIPLLISSVFIIGCKEHRTEQISFVERMASAFDQIDKNKDGRIDKAELEMYLSAVSTQTSDSYAKMTREEFRNADKNKDGLVSKSEFVAYQELGIQCADADHDGKISENEFTARAVQCSGVKNK